MIKQLFKRAEAIRRQVAAPLAGSGIANLRDCAERGAKSSSLRNVACTLVAVAQFLKLVEQGTVRLYELEYAAELWVCEDPGHRGGVVGPRTSGFSHIEVGGCDLPAAWKMLRSRSHVTPTSFRSSSTTCGVRRAGPRPRFGPTWPARKSSCARSARECTRSPTSRWLMSTAT